MFVPAYCLASSGGFNGLQDLQDLDFYLKNIKIYKTVIIFKKYRISNWQLKLKFLFVCMRWQIFDSDVQRNEN